MSAPDPSPRQPPPEQASVRNNLLRLMSPQDFARVAPHLQPGHLSKGEMILARGVPVTYATFMEDSIGSAVAVSHEGHRIEAGLFGRDGFWPVSLAMSDDRSVYDCVAQLPGNCWRIPADAFRAALDSSPTLHALMLRYVQALSVQTSYTALSNAVHPIDERLARWLLMCDDRVDTDLPLTHEFLSLMLAVRRPSVTTALHVLEGNGFIRAERGCIVIRNRAALEEFAGDAYGVPEAEYERLIGPLNPGR